MRASSPVVGSAGVPEVGSKSRVDARFAPNVSSGRCMACASTSSTRARAASVAPPAGGSGSGAGVSGSGAGVSGGTSVPSPASGCQPAPLQRCSASHWWVSGDHTDLAREGRTGRELSHIRRQVATWGPPGSNSSPAASRRMAFHQFEWSSSSTLPRPWRSRSLNAAARSPSMARMGRPKRMRTGGRPGFGQLRPLGMAW